MPDCVQGVLELGHALLTALGTRGSTASVPSPILVPALLRCELLCLRALCGERIHQQSLNNLVSRLCMVSKLRTVSAPVRHLTHFIAVCAAEGLGQE